MAFSEERFNDNMIIYNTRGGPNYSTATVQTNGGREQRNATWDQPRSTYQFNDRLIDETEKDYIMSFFNAMEGMLTGFRFKDWADYQTKGAGVVNSNGKGNGTANGQLYKSYAAGAKKKFKKISKPLAIGFSASMDGSPISVTLDPTTGIITLPATTKTITTVAPNGVTTFTITSTAHGFLNGDFVNLALAGGSWSAFNGFKQITVIDANTYRVNGNAASAGTFTSGNATWFPQIRNNLTWTGEFDIPVRFDSDHIELEMTSAEVVSYGQLGQKFFNFSGINLIELKL